MDYSKYKMYILINEWVEPGYAACSSAHGAMMIQDLLSGTQPFDGWKKESFKKFTCAMSNSEMELAKRVLINNNIRYIDVNESNLGCEHILTIVEPIDASRHELKAFKFFRPYNTNNIKIKQ